ncbi:hypothetical protein HPULCUR_005229 [Helicostylum pulchrum]|uniref:6-phosphofructokinase n=1 Tax=Helicostylum pulchrum TaxID=562976 RepID=A0ABP9XZG3_9FUNG
MLSQGLSHIIFNASNNEDFERAIEFYTSLGFKNLSEKEQADETVVWLKLGSDSNVIIKLVFTTSAFAQHKPAGDVDWSLEEAAIAFSINDVEAVKFKLDELDAPFQDHSKDGLTKLYVLDPLSNMILLTNNEPCVLKATSAAAAVEAAASNSERQKIAVLTSGGDAPGMNAVVRAAIKGGTSIGTARCMPFKTREGRLKAAENLVVNGIDALIVCGGDGSLTGADLFRGEWAGLIEELESTNRITKEQAEKYNVLTIVGLVGSIDNDMSSTDITIGAVTSLHRICEAVDAVSTTALSHSRAFVVEVMGRHCGWLALMAGIATGADFVFIPEKPPQQEDWESFMCSVVERHRHLGKRKTVVIVAEGAIDKNLNAIKAEYLKDILTNRLGLDTRVTILGHTQRGGSPAFFDRLLATTQGIEAVNAVLEATKDTPTPMIGMTDNRITRFPLMKAVKLTHEVAEAISVKNFGRAMELRDPQFAEEFEAYNATTIMDDNSLCLPAHERLRIAIIHTGAPAGGMNAATRTAVRFCLNRGHTPIAVNNGFVGLARGSMSEMTWMSVDGWTALGGSELGTNRAVPGEDIDMGMVTYQLQKNRIQALMVVGGFEAFVALRKLEEARDQYPGLRIPITLIPATISNNVPGTDYSLGSDTSLNAIVTSCDAIVQSAQSSRRRVFVVEVMGGRSGYLAVEAGLAVGANTVYIPEETINLARLQADVNHLKAMYTDDDPDKSEGRIILRTEDVSKTYTTEVISDILKEEGNEMFDSRTAVLGHTQQGITPSPLDRIRATRLAKHCIEFFEQHTSEALNSANDRRAVAPIELTNCSASVAVAGIEGSAVVFPPISELLKVTDMKNRKPRTAWWTEHRPIIDLLAGRGFFKA